MDYDVDFTGVSSSRYLPPGIYQARLAKVEEQPGRVAPQFVWTFEAQGGKSRINTSLSPGALWKLQEVLEALGVQAQGHMRLSVARLEKLIGRVCTIVVEEEEGEDGKSYSKIQKLMPPTDEAPPAEMPETVADFDEIPF